MILFLVFFCYPVLRTLAMSFFEVKSISSKVSTWTFAGLDNFKALNMTSFPSTLGMLFKVWAICGIIVFVVALLYAVMILACKHVTGIAGLERTTIQILVACAVVAVYNLVTDQPPVSWSTESVIATAVLGVVNTGAACYLYFSSIPELPAQTVAVCSYLDPLSALVFSALFLDERMSAVQMVGAACILGGAAFAELYKGKKRSGAV